MGRVFNNNLGGPGFQSEGQVHTKGLKKMVLNTSLLST